MRRLGFPGGVALGLSLLLWAFGAANVRAEATRTDRIVLDDAEPGIARRSRIAFYGYTNLAIGLAIGTQAPDPARTGMQLDVRPDPLVAPRYASPGALNRTSASGGSKASPDDAKPSAGNMGSKAWGLGFFRSDVLRQSDRATFWAYLPMRGAARLPRISQALFDSEEPGSFASSARALSLIAQRRINTEFAYSSQLGRSGNLDATARFRLNADPRTGKSDLVVGITYKMTF